MRAFHGLCNQKQFKDLFQFIKKNTYIPNFLAGIKPQDAKVEELLIALKKGDANAEIFNHHNCYLYLLYLLKTNKFPFWPGMTVYAFLTVLMQFTNRQPIRDEDKSTKFIRKIEVYALSHENTLTIEGKKYLESIQNHLEELHYKLDYSQLETFILNLPPVEQWLVKIPHVKPHYQDKSTDTDLLLNVLLTNVPFFSLASDRDGDYGLFPSYSMINYLLRKISPVPIYLMPIFGTISNETLRKLHEQNIHPVSLYGLHINSNPRNADDYFCGPSVMSDHDKAHGVWGTMLLPSEREIIFKHFIPQLGSWLEIAKQSQDKLFINFLQLAINDANDFNLTSVKHFCNSNRLILYLARVLGIEKYSIVGKPYTRAATEKLGEPIEDRLYFLVIKLQYELPPGKPKDFWIELAEMIRKHLFYKCPTIVETIQELAKAAAGTNDILVSLQTTNPTETQAQYRAPSP